MAPTLDVPVLFNVARGADVCCSWLYHEQNTLNGVQITYHHVIPAKTFHTFREVSTHNVSGITFSQLYHPNQELVVFGMKLQVLEPADPQVPQCWIFFWQSTKNEMIE